MARGKKVVSGKGSIDEKKLVDAEGDETTTTVVTTEDQSVRESKGKPAVMEKSTENEKDNAPSIICTWTDSQGRRRSKTFTCASMSLLEHKTEQFTKATHKTVLDISIEAQVIEVI